jgi:murein DD-endopeptidase MepM/ murein hydrolase activator NlpD
MSPVAGAAAWRVGQAPGGTTSHNADLHHGWDFSLASNGNEFGFGVYAVAAGTVKWVVEYVPDGDASQMTKDFSHGPNGSLGNIVTIEHKAAGVTFYSSYLHLRQNSVTVSVGDKVNAGDLIAEIGNTGVRDGTHLHLNLGLTYGPYTNSAGASFNAYMIAEGPRDPNLLSRFDFIDSQRASKELHVGDQFVSTTPPRGASSSSSKGQDDTFPGVGGGDDLAFGDLFGADHLDRGPGTQEARLFARLNLSAFEPSESPGMEPLRPVDVLGGIWELP